MKSRASSQNAKKHISSRLSRKSFMIVRAEIISGPEAGDEGRCDIKQGTSSSLQRVPGEQAWVSQKRDRV